MAARKPPSTPGPPAPPDGAPPVAEPGLLDTALAPLRVPTRLVRALDMVTEALADVPPMRDEVVTIRKQSESLDELLPALESMKTELAGRLDSMQKAMGALEGIEDDLDHTVKQLLVRMDAMHETVLSLQDDVQRITDRLPDPDDAGPLERARDALTGGGRG